MSTIKRILFGAFMAAALGAQSAHLVVAPVDFQGAAYTNRVVVLTPTEARGELPYIYTIEPRKQTVTDGSGVTFSNTFAGTYKLEISGSPYTSLRLLVPDTNGLVNAVSCIVVSTNAVEDSAAWAWSAAASDARYAATGESGSGSGETIDAGSVPAEERLRFPIGDGLYARATVHPNALWLPTNWNGAQIWLAFTGTTNQSATAFGTDTEDPFIYASADGGNTWTLKSAAPLLSKADSQTIAGWSSSGWQADTELYLDTNGVMRLIWMGYHPYGGSFSNVLFHSQSADGTNWSTPVVLRKWASDAGNPWSTNAAMAGPQVVAMPQGLRLYWVDDGNYGTNASGVGTNSLWYVPALDGSGTNWDWASAAPCTLSPYLTNNSAPWHFDIALVGSNLWYLQYGSQAASFGEYSTSTNGVNWSPPGMGLFLSSGLKQRPEEYGFYKSTWAPVPGANVPTFNAIVGHTPLTQANVEGWNFSLVRGLVPDPLSLVFTGVNTNRLLIGGNPLYSGVGNIGALTVIAKKSDSSSAAVVTIGQPFTGWGGVAAGANAPMDATNYILASDGLTETRLNARGSGSVNIAVNNAVKATVTSSNASFAVPVDFQDTISVVAITNSGSLYNSGGIQGYGGMTLHGGNLNAESSDATFSSVEAGNITASGTFTGDGSGLTNHPARVPFGAGATVVIEGDSRLSDETYGGPATWLRLFGTGSFTNVALGGDRLTNMWATYTNQIQSQVGSDKWLIFWASINDNNSGTPVEDTLTCLTNIMRQSKADGFTLVVCTEADAPTIQTDAKQAFLWAVSDAITHSPYPDYVVPLHALIPPFPVTTNYWLNDGSSHFTTNTGRLIAEQILRTCVGPAHAAPAPWFSTNLYGRTVSGNAANFTSVSAATVTAGSLVSSNAEFRATDSREVLFTGGGYTNYAIRYGTGSDRKMTLAVNSINVTKSTDSTGQGVLIQPSGGYATFGGIVNIPTLVASSAVVSNFNVYTLSSSTNTVFAGPSNNTATIKLTFGDATDRTLAITHNSIDCQNYAGAAQSMTLQYNGGSILSRGNWTTEKVMTASNFVATATNTATPSFKSAGTNNMILLAPDGGRWILCVSNNGALFTVTNSSGL
jgi:hypothetical protein